MLRDKARNTIVGLTFIVAVVAFVMGVFFLGRLPSFGPDAPYRVKVIAPNASGLSFGDNVNLNGVTVGTVHQVTVAKDFSGARINLSIYHDITLPANTFAKIGSRAIGTPYVSLIVPQPSATAHLSKDGTAIVSGSLASSGLIPDSVLGNFTALRKDFGHLSGKLDQLADDLHAMLKPVTLTTAQATGKADTPSDMSNMSALIQRLNVTISSFNRIVADQKLQLQVRQIVSNVADSSVKLKGILTRLNGTVTQAGKVLTTANTAVSDIDSTAKSVHGRIVSVSVHLTDLLEHLDAITQTIAAGHGTAGRLLKDPRLYNALLDVTHKLNKTVDDLHALVKQIQANGVNLNVHF